MKILIAEDEIVSRKKMEIIIKNIGYEPICTTNGVEAFELWKKERPKIVITDWIMPEMTGLDLCRSIRENEGSQYTYLIIVSTKNEKIDLIKGIDSGADDFISKPFIKEEIAVRIRSGRRILDFGSRDIAIFAISKLVESRDPETGNHLERIRYYSRILAESLLKLKNPPKEIDILFIDNLFLTSPLHDIGKIGIPDYILLKAGQLDDREYETMKKHTIIGYNTLNEAAMKDPKAEYLRMSADIALSHHEKYNGAGYPNGLKGNEIPLSARIVALADVYDALVSKRVYKETFAHDVARSIIIDDKGKHFDPLLVDAFLLSEDKFTKIYNKFIAA